MIRQVNKMNIEFEKFQNEVYKNFLKSQNIPEDILNQEFKRYEKAWSESKYQWLKEHAIMIASNSMYFPLKTRLKLAFYIIFGMGRKNK